MQGSRAGCPIAPDPGLTYGGRSADLPPWVVLVANAWLTRSTTRNQKGVTHEFRLGKCRDPNAQLERLIRNAMVSVQRLSALDRLDQAEIGQRAYQIERGGH